MAFDKVLALWREQYSAKLARPILHQEFIGEAWGMIYAPFYLDNRVMDAILNEPVSTTPVDQISESLLQADNCDWSIDFLATLCPHCGWDLSGEKDALALTCDSCQRLWWVRKGRLEELHAGYVPDNDLSTVYLPF